MTLDAQILGLLADGPRTLDALLLAETGVVRRVLTMRLGFIVSRGRARLQADGLYHLHDGVPKPRKKPQKAEPAQLELFDAAVWLDGTVCIRGAELSAGGQVILPPDAARRLARHILAVSAEAPANPLIANDVS